MATNPRRRLQELKFPRTNWEKAKYRRRSLDYTNTPIGHIGLAYRFAKIDLQNKIDLHLLTNYNPLINLQAYVAARNAGFNVLKESREKNYKKIYDLAYQAARDTYIFEIKNYIPKPPIKTKPKK